MTSPATIIGVSELRANLNRYLELARSGQLVAVSERGIVIAHLTAAPPPLGARLREARAAGLIGGGSGRLKPRRPSAKLKSGRPLAALISEDRDA